MKCFPQQNNAINDVATCHFASIMHRYSVTLSRVHSLTLAKLVYTIHWNSLEPFLIFCLEQTRFFFLQSSELSRVNNTLSFFLHLSPFKLNFLHCYKNLTSSLHSKRELMWTFIAAVHTATSESLYFSRWIKQSEESQMKFLFYGDLCFSYNRKQTCH